MKYLKLVLILFLLLPFYLLEAQPSKKTVKELKSTPPRIIRACCAFGSDLHLVGIPFMTITHITSPDQLGEHKYLGNKSEGNGLIYTERGGFIDIGHLRDIADWTKYLYSVILNSRGEGRVVQKLGYEGGHKNLYFDIDADMDSLDCLYLAGKVAYDLSLWHELSTWFGASTIPMMPERYSSFSVEDVYSNLLGVLIAMDALKSNKPYNEAMTSLLYDKMQELLAVSTEKGTYDALEVVRDVWWTRDKRLPNKKVIIERDTDVLTYVHPWIVPDSNLTVEPVVLEVPLKNSKGEDLLGFYELQIDLNYKFPVDEIFPKRDTHIITQYDLGVMLKRVSADLGIPDYETTEQPQTLHAKSDKNSL